MLADNDVSIQSPLALKVVHFFMPQFTEMLFITKLRCVCLFWGAAGRIAFCRQKRNYAKMNSQQINVVDLKGGTRQRFKRVFFFSATMEVPWEQKEKYVLMGRKNQEKYDSDREVMTRKHYVYHPAKKRNEM